MRRSFADAEHFARNLHSGQFRKGTEIPYFEHLKSVAVIVQDSGGTNEQIIAALLHDAVEDQGGVQTLDQIRLLFGDCVASIVLECTDSIDKSNTSWYHRKKEYLSHISKMSSEALLISIADKVHNAGCILKDYLEIGEALWNRFSGGKEGVLWYYGRLVEEFEARGIYPDLVKILRDTVSELQQNLKITSKDSSS